MRRLLLWRRSELTALSLGEDVARSSGVDVDRLTWRTLIGVAIITAVSQTGTQLASTFDKIKTQL